MKKRVCCGFEITVEPESSYSGPTTIVLHKRGVQGSSSWFTPGEMRTMIAELSAALEEAEKKR